jgi:protein-disulfide isomerase
MFPPRGWRLLNLSATLGIALALSACGGSDVRARSGTTPAKQTDDIAGVAETKALLAGLTQRQLSLGSPKAPVTLAEVIDLQCPFCRSHQLDAQPRIVNELVRTGRLRIVLIPVSFLGTDSTRMEVVMLRLSQTGQAWAFANLVYWNQGQEGSGYATDGWLRRIVSAIPGTDPSAASTTPDRDILQAAQASKIIAEQGLARAGGAGTPFFMIGKTGTPLYELTPILAGAPPNTFDVIERAVEDVERGRTPEQLRAEQAPSNAGGA